MGNIKEEFSVKSAFNMIRKRREGGDWFNEIGLKDSLLKSIFSIGGSGRGESPQMIT